MPRTGRVTAATADVQAALDNLRITIRTRQQPRPEAVPPVAMAWPAAGFENVPDDGNNYIPRSTVNIRNASADNNVVVIDFYDGSGYGNGQFRANSDRMLEIARAIHDFAAMTFVANEQRQEQENN